MSALRGQRLLRPADPRQPSFAGLEADLVFDRGSERVVFEIKAGEGEPLRTMRRLQSATTDIDARRSYLITQADGIVALAPKVERRGFARCVDWLP